jgi:hypothetical protein
MSGTPEHLQISPIKVRHRRRSETSKATRRRYSRECKTGKPIMGPDRSKPSTYLFAINCEKTNSFFLSIEMQDMSSSNPFSARPIFFLHLEAFLSPFLNAKTAFGPCGPLLCPFSEHSIYLGGSTGTANTRSRSHRQSVEISSLRAPVRVGRAEARCRGHPPRHGRGRASVRLPCSGTCAPLHLGASVRVRDGRASDPRSTDILPGTCIRSILDGQKAMPSSR